MNYGFLLAGLLELLGLSAVPFPLYERGATPALRVAKPAATLALCYFCSKIHALAGLAYVTGQAAFGMAAHREYCRGRGKTNWIGTTSPYLFRNPGQIRLWEALTTAAPQYTG
mmetsp:Transcript_6063/g.17912  ORF Transcript_6063/g.17912 Transcript_6063/m.17912 type:complete len:113 (+) Transcript_6063:176-514(+)